MSFDRSRPYNDLPDLPPQVELETKAVLKEAIRARAALAELKGAGGLLPDQTILLNSVVLQEAQASSAIENIVTTQDELYRASGPDDATASANAKEVLRYREALWSGFQQLQSRPLGTNCFIQICRVIKKSDLGLRRVPGIKVARAGGEVVYTPPEGEELIRAKLSNLERFLYAEDDLDPLVRLAVLHYQFEAIHPFADGNGRTGRIVNILFLVEQGLLDLPILFLSGYFLAHRDEYYRGFRRVTEEQQWEPWIRHVLRAVAETAADTHRKILAIRDCLAEVAERTRQVAPAVYSKDLIELVFRQPYCRTGQVIEQLRVSRSTATKYLRTLADLGCLQAHKRGREVLFVNLPLLAQLQREPSGDR